MIWIIIVIAGLLIYFTMNNLKDGSAGASPIKGSPDNSNLILAPRKEVITDLNEQMAINHFAGMLENLSKDRVQSVYYKTDKALLELIGHFYHSLYSIPVNKIREESIQNKYKTDRNLQSAFLEDFNQLCSDLVNEKSSFVDIRETLENWLIRIYSEAKSQIKEPTSGRGNSKIAPEINNLVDVVSIIEAEKLFNKGTELFDAGQFESAVNFFEKAAELNDKDALYQLGNAYLEGRGVSQNLNKSFEYYLKSANLEHEKAQYNVGLFYLQGKLGDRNIDEGLKWIKKSAAYGYPDAQKVLQHLNIN